MLPRLAAVLFALAGAASTAQVQPGDIAITGFSGATFGLLGLGPNAQTISTGGFQGSGLGKSPTGTRPATQAPSARAMCSG
jgi:hypothetical protein